MLPPLFANLITWSLNPVFSYWMVALAACALVVLLFIGPTRDKTTRRRRRVLGVLRLFVVLLLLLAMLRPTIVRTKITKQAATLVLLLDRSRSMLVRDMVGKKTRWQEMQTALEGALPALGELARDLEVKLFTFDGDLHPLEFNPQKLDLGGEPDGKQTALGYALDELLKAEAGKRLLGVIVLSDGAQRAYAPHDEAPQVPVRRMADLGYPLYAVPFGQPRGPDQARDVALDELATPDELYVKTTLVVEVALRSEGMENQRFPVELLFETAPGKMEPVATRQATAGPNGERQAVELDYVPDVPGEHKLTVRVPLQPGEMVNTNNEVSTFVTVLKGGLNVFYLDGSMQPEQKFLRWSLGEAKEMRVDYQYIRADRKEGRPRKGAERFEPGKYDVYILGDLDSSAFPDDELERLAAAVERGAGLLMLGGLHSFGPGGYGKTPLADLLPVRIDRLERQNFGEPIRSDLHLTGRLQMRPTKQGGKLPPMQLAPGEQNDTAWSQLSPLEGANRFAGLKKGAYVLAESGDGDPLLVGSDYAAGRVLAFAGDSTWRWWMEGHEAEHKRFWRQVVLWLAHKDKSTEGNVWISLDQRRYEPASRVEFAAGAEDKNGQPVADATFEAEVILPGGKRAPLHLRRQSDEMLGSFADTGAPGDYTIVVKARTKDEIVGTGQARFLVFDQDLELNNPAADLGALESLAAATGGKSMAPEQLPNLLAELKKATHLLDVETQSKETLWDRWPPFLLFVGLLAVEWILRKRWGLV